MSKVLKRNSVIIDEEKYIVPVTTKKVADIPEEIPEEEVYDEGEGEEPEIEPEKQYTPPEIFPEEEKEEFTKETANELIGEEIIAQAQRTADLIVNHTLENARIELNNAVSDGYRDGFETGRNEAMSVIAPALDKIGLLADTVIKMQDKMLEDFRDGMIGIISEISTKIIHREIDEKDEYLATLFADAVKDIKAENFVTVTVGECQAEFAVRNIDLFKSKVANIDDFKIISDKNSGRGTMIVETAKTVADASFSVQIGKINSILERMKKNMTVPPLDAEAGFSGDDTV